MPLGDSITYGVGSLSSAGYRQPLYQSLLDAGYSVDFVGSQTSDFPEGFDGDHEGHIAWRADQIRANVTAWLNSNPADIVLLHIGTNDITEGEGAASTAADIGEILDDIDAWEALNNEIWVVLARIVNRNDGYVAETTTLNGLIQDLADTRIAAGDRIVVVDMESALSYPGDLADIWHPDYGGYVKMAAVWFTALEAVFMQLPDPDHDGDGDVDGSDLAMVIAAFGSGTGDLNYDARCDLDPNGNIDEADLALFAPEFGWQAPEPEAAAAAASATMALDASDFAEFIDFFATGRKRGYEQAERTSRKNHSLK